MKAPRCFSLGRARCGCVSTPGVNLQGLPLLPLSGSNFLKAQEAEALRKKGANRPLWDELDVTAVFPNQSAPLQETRKTSFPPLGP